MQVVDVDLTGIACALIAGVFSILSIVLPMMINARIKDAQAADTLGTAVKNSLGALQQASIAAAKGIKPIAVSLPSGVPPELATGVQYVLDHAGPEAARFGITPEAIASKISAQIGLVSIAQSAPAAAATLPATVVPSTNAATVNVQSAPVDKSLSADFAHN